MKLNEATWEDLAEKAKFRPARLAECCGYSLRTLQRHFSKTYGLTVRDWLRQFRIAKAYSLLTSGSRVKVVAVDLGYKQLSHFSRDFKAVIGVPPSAITRSKLNAMVPPTRLASGVIISIGGDFHAPRQISEIQLTAGGSNPGR